MKWELGGGGYYSHAAGKKVRYFAKKFSKGGIVCLGEWKKDFVILMSQLMILFCEI